MASYNLHSIGMRIAAYAGSGSLNNSTHPLDASTDAIEFIYQMPEAATITTVGFLYGFRTGTPPTYRASIQSVNTSGRASGTILGGGTPASKTFTPPANGSWDGTWQEVTLDNSIALTRGQFVAVVIDYSSGTVNGSNNGEFAHGLVSNGSVTPWAFPFAVTVNAGAGTKQNSRVPVFSLKSASKSYGYPGLTLRSDAYSSDSTPDERALRFLLAAGWGDTFQVVGVRFLCRAAAAAKSVLISLYTGTTTLQAVTWDCDATGSTPAGSDRLVTEIYFDESSLTTLNYNTEYRIGFAPQETSANFALAAIRVNAAGDATAYPGSSAFYMSTRSDAGAWSDVTTDLPLVELILADSTEPAGGGGGLLINPGQGGGMGA